MLENPAPRAAARLLLLAAVVACGNAPAPTVAATIPPPAPAPAPTVAPEPPDGPVPTLRTGALAPIEHADPVTGRVERRLVQGGMETLRVVVNSGPAGLPERYTDRSLIVVSTGDGAPLSFVADATVADGSAAWPIWIRRPASLAGTPVVADVFLHAWGTGAPGEHFVVHADDPRATPSDPTVLGDWERALAGHLSTWRSKGPFQTFAARKLLELADRDHPPPKPPKTAKAPGGRPAIVNRPTPNAQAAGELGELMETTTGTIAVQEMLQHDRSLFLSDAALPPKLPVDAAKSPTLARHPWDDMLRKLGKKGAPEPLADAAPAEFYYARASSLTALFRVLDQMDAWGTAASRALDGNAEDRGVAARYEEELAVFRGPLTRALGPSVLGEIAVVGSDPYVKEGSDVTLILRVKNRALFDAGLEQARAPFSQAPRVVSRRKVTMGGVEVSVFESNDGRVRQHRATVGDLEILSNSPAAIARVLETIAGKHPRLSDEKDFQYMLARDVGAKAEVLAYAGDRFVAEVIGPRQKIAEARRQIALAELMTPGFASLLYGTLEGKSPGSVADVTKARLLSSAELTHKHGGAIAWRPGQAARSSWGTVAALTPLIDLPRVDTITVAERDGYERFANSYRWSWSHYVDPVAARLSFEDDGPRARMTMDLRQLPLIEETHYRDIASFVGASRFEVGPLDSGARVVVGIGKDSEARTLTRELRSLSRKHDLAFDWLGDWAMLGLVDRAQVATSTLGAFDEDLPQAPAETSRRRSRLDSLLVQTSKLPLYGAIAIKSPLGATVALAALRAMADDSTPGLLEWGEAAKERDISIVRVALNEKKARDEFGEDVSTQVFYAVARGAILVSLNEYALRALIDERMDGKGAREPVDEGGGEQLALDFGSDRGKGLWSSVAWLLEAAVLKDDSQAARANAEALFQGAPDVASAKDDKATRALAFAVFGAVPLSPDGGTFVPSVQGVRDPSRGTPFAPVWPSVPIPGSPVEALMTGMAHARASLSFDDEPQVGPDAMRSLHARVSVQVPKE